MDAEVFDRRPSTYSHQSSPRKNRRIDRFWWFWMVCPAIFVVKAPYFSVSSLWNGKQSGFPIGVTAWITSSRRGNQSHVSWHRSTAHTSVLAAHRSTMSSHRSEKASSPTLTFRDSLQSRTVNSWVQQLDRETLENYQKSLLQSRLPLDQTNTTKRPVFNGHYVLVAPTPLPNPRLVLYSTDVAESMLGFSSEQMHDDDFLKFVSGNIQGIAKDNTSWATPYALSIMGTKYTNNCPFGTGDGYGDGRAISIAEITGADGAAAFELQLKGAGTTPFHRGADGRAVFRSSIREFLASEAMHYLKVPTTRALSLVVSATATSQRPWYRDQMDSMSEGDSPFKSSRRSSSIPTMDDPRLAQYSDDQKRQIILQVRRQNKADPDIMIAEPNAITCRVATSFTRIGHLDLFARRAIGFSKPQSAPYATDSLAWKELEKMIWHACYREYRSVAYDPFFETQDIAGAATALLEHSAENIAQMVAEWIRVGFAQGNFNADNCLVGGNTMDYGPFGYIEEYDPLFAKWTGSGQHFGFLNQPNAGFANYGILVESVVPVIAAAQGNNDHTDLQSSFLERAQEIFQSKVDEVFRVKLGFQSHQDAADDVWEAVEPLLRSSRVDYTIFFRELSYLVRDIPNILDSSFSLNADELFSQLRGSDAGRPGSSPFYEALPPDLLSKWLVWIEMWRSTLTNSCSDSQEVVATRMLQTNPKYILREWMLVNAYQKASDNDESELLALYSLIQRPYDEGNPDEIERYYRRAPEEALLTGGTAFMS